MAAPSTWVVDRTGDLLQLDGSVGVVDVRAEMLQACNGQANIRAELRAGGLMWRIVGKGWELQAMGGIERALRIAAMSSEWREQRPEPAEPADVAADAARLFDNVQHGRP